MIQKVNAIQIPVLKRRKSGVYFSLPNLNLTAHLNADYGTRMGWLKIALEHVTDWLTIWEQRRYGLKSVKVRNFTACCRLVKSE